MHVKLRLSNKYVSTNIVSWGREEMNSICVVREGFIEEVVIVMYSFSN